MDFLILKQTDYLPACNIEPQSDSPLGKVCFASGVHRRHAYHGGNRNIVIDDHAYIRKPIPAVVGEIDSGSEKLLYDNRIG